MLLAPAYLNGRSLRRRPLFPYPPIPDHVGASRVSRRLEIYKSFLRTSKLICNKNSRLFCRWEIPLQRRHDIERACQKKGIARFSTRVAQLGNCKGGLYCSVNLNHAPLGLLAPIPDQDEPNFPKLATLSVLSPGESQLQHQ